MLPQASAGPSFQEEMLSGKFQGTIRPTTPSGSRNVRSTPPATGIVSPNVLVDRARVVVEDLRDHADLAARALDRLADVARLEARELLAVLLDERREPPQQPGPVGGRDGAPGRERLLRAGDGRVRLLDAGRLDLGDRLLGRGIDDGGHLRAASTSCSKRR